MVELRVACLVVMLLNLVTGITSYRAPPGGNAALIKTTDPLN